MIITSSPWSRNSWTTSLEPFSLIDEKFLESFEIVKLFEFDIFMSYKYFSCVLFDDKLDSTKVTTCLNVTGKEKSVWSKQKKWEISYENKQKVGERFWPKPMRLIVVVISLVQGRRILWATNKKICNAWTSKLRKKINSPIRSGCFGKYTE